MKVLRETAIETGSPAIGDRIEVRFSGKRHYATAIQREPGGMLFLFDDCMGETMPMNRKGGTSGGYEESDIRKFLKDADFGLPDALEGSLVTNEDGDTLFLLTMQQVFGLDEEWNETEGQIEWMKDCRHRIAFRNNEPGCWWLRSVVSGAGFAYVHYNGYCNHYSGYCNHYGASLPHGVRPAFIIKETQNDLE